MKITKSQLWVSAVLYLLISAVVVIIVLEGGVPLIKKMQDRAVFSKKRADFVDLSTSFEQVAKEEQGSQRVIPLEVEKGLVKIEDDKVKWLMDTEAEIIEPRSKIRVGNINILSNADVRAYYDSISDTYIMENSYILINISRIGNNTNHSNYNTQDIIKNMYLKQTNSYVPGLFRFYVSNEPDTAIGEGYTELIDYGSNLDKASVIAFMNSSENITYTLKLTLHADTDYLISTLEMS